MVMRMPYALGASPTNGIHYQDALRETSRPWAPWYAIPADNKPYMRYAVAKIIAQSMESLHMHYPKVDDAAKQRFAHLREMLVEES